ncbi:glutamate 5-kinase [Erysipelatoclostridium sp. An173]|uniref:Glutamate 5-kinase n=1 Tax=Candidatus Erysipelatoclostridium merdavium TaxID=2838566 RepID=A0A9D1XK83_9FIRM|nr:glutamate 5-kinase [Erysipelatoclostridium sp. An173]OUP77122.1 glutamate 5-kinase [Erysipelatoclostridium sp. An173]WRK55224.1 glutamate 5-kinase [Coprobacillaceae bacterium CR2/5/TPMF4]HIX80854.1 glutamate 5-kinase [Candidatus Erysipelatoclostridium merdavium]
MRNLEKVKNIIVKIGSSSLCDQNGNIDKEKILNLIQQIAYIKRKNIKITLVSSGAINAGVHIMNLKQRPDTIPQKQALAAIGQASLMQIYEDLFSLFKLKCAQILLNHDDFDDRKRLMNFNNAMQAIIDYDVVPIINENDTLAVDEIKVGDNDTLASMIVPAVNADLVIIVSDIDGLYDDNPHTNKDAKLISNVAGITKTIENMAKDASSKVGTGGMITKIKAAKICNEFGCDLAIVNGNQPNVLIDLLEGKEVGTYFDSTPVRHLSSRQHWIMYRSMPKGKIIVDDGARLALVNKHTSLLPKGIVNVEGNFLMSQIVDIVDCNNDLIARGIANYSSDEIRLIKGLNSSEIETVLHYKDYDEVVHANNLVLVKEVNK